MTVLLAWPAPRHGSHDKAHYEADHAYEKQDLSSGLEVDGSDLAKVHGVGDYRADGDQKE